MHHSISLYLKLETIIQDLVSRVTSQLFSSLLHPSHLTQYRPKLLPCLSPFNTFSIPLFLFVLPPSSLLIVLPPCSSPLVSNTVADLLNLNSAAYLSVQVLQRCMIPVTWQFL